MKVGSQVPRVPGMGHRDTDRIAVQVIRKFRWQANRVAEAILMPVKSGRGPLWRRPTGADGSVRSLILRSRHKGTASTDACSGLRGTDNQRLEMLQTAVYWLPVSAVNNQPRGRLVRLPLLRWLGHLADGEDGLRRQGHCLPSVIPYPPGWSPCGRPR